MNKFNPNKNIIIGLILTILVVAIVSITSERRAKGVEVTTATSMVNDSVGFVDKIVGFPGQFINNLISSVNNLVNTYQENEQLKSRLDNYDEAIIQTKNQEEEINKLKAELKLNATLSSYSKTAANVISRSPDTWQDILVIDKGKSDGIAVNMAVMSGQGLVGRVLQVNDKTSKVELLTSSNQSSNHFPIKIMTSEENTFGLLKNYDEKTQTFVLGQITGSSKIQKGDIVQTSGLGGLSPANLLVGTVLDVKQSENGLEKVVYVTPSTKMYDISLVTVIKRVIEDVKE